MIPLKWTNNSVNLTNAKNTHLNACTGRQDDSVQERQTNYQGSTPGQEPNVFVKRCLKITIYMIQHDSGLESSKNLSLGDSMSP